MDEIIRQSSPFESEGLSATASRGVADGGSASPESGAGTTGGTGSRSPADSGSIRLFRAHPRGRFGRVGEFWSSDPEYPKYIHGSDAPYAFADLDEHARIVRFPGGAPSKADIERLRSGDYDVAVWPIWDFPGDEFVILNPRVLLNITLIDEMGLGGDPGTPVASAVERRSSSRGSVGL